jgi:hypothetical protein
MNPTAFRWPRVLNEDRRCPYLGRQSRAVGRAILRHCCGFVVAARRTGRASVGEDGYVREAAVQAVGAGWSSVTRGCWDRLLRVLPGARSPGSANNPTSPGGLLGPALLGAAGCEPLTAAKIIGEAAGVDRFKSRDAYARHNRTAPLPVWLSNRGPAPAEPHRKPSAKRCVGSDRSHQSPMASSRPAESARRRDATGSLAGRVFHIRPA